MTLFDFSYINQSLTLTSIDSRYNNQKVFVIGNCGMPRGGKREGSGRPKGVTIPTYVLRVPTDIDRELINKLPELRALIDHWEEECIAAGEGSARHHFLRQMIEEIRVLGY